ncbi:hypothetical protein FOA43_003926 [Brettanomyces nanus]|uniref:Mitochondrial zinc maintenance protein 1, mitochondrial n=1 Tax=Eeniella nana TaxID=13502 RepID=A0A875RWV7_EENNA|nr:uncharacterized protein FOA43_003926 [Brettanomyces nanus]QPG76537.1 hypothetical protein FOA43_003926 [Brettanomyces nanus]
MIITMPSELRALNAYRSTIRAINLAFGGDLRTQSAAKLRLKTEMKKEQSRDHPEMNVEQRITLLNQIATYLTKNIVQGVKEEGKDRYVLRIHKGTELGDNKDIEKMKTTLRAGATTGSGCCGGSDTVNLKQMPKRKQPKAN